jgi:diguanylate cyclase (GGDEF)-like protein
MSEQERIMNVALLWGGCFCLTAAFCLSMGNDHNREKRNWLLWMELSAAALLCCDAAAWFVQGTPGEASHLIMVATNFVVYAGLYLVLFLFNHYVGCYLREDGRLCAPKRSRTVDITCAVGIGLVFVSQFSPLLYYIDAQNIYHRSDAFPLSMVLLLIGMGTETTMMAQFYQKLTMGRRIAMFGCVVLPLSVAACQVFQDDISLISLSVGASMILLFVVATSAQNRELAVSERTKEQIRQRLEIATVLNSCVGKLNSDTDIDVGINNLLATVNGYFQADRTYVFEIDPDRDVLINTFEYICGQEVSAQMDNLQEVPVSVIKVWMQNFRQGRSYYMSDLEQERGQPSYEMLKAQQVWRLLAVPLMKGGAMVGFLGVDNPRAHYDDATLLASIQFFVTNSLDRKKQQAYLEKLSYRDMLTGLYNRNRYIERLEAYKQVQDQQIGAIYIDLNGLKKVNDEQGHRAGDELIVRAAGTIAGIFAEDAYRVGGDEFVVILLDVSREDFARKTEQLRHQMQENSVDASIGGVWQASTENLENLLRRADENMYREKKRYYSQADAARKPES